jgi:hypothetical protein
MFNLSSTVAPLVIFGYVVSDSSNVVLWYQMFDTPITLENAGDQIVFSPVMSFFSQNSGG